MVLDEAALADPKTSALRGRFQTLGVKSRRFASAIQWLGLAVAGVIFVGNVLIVLAVWVGYVGHAE